MQTTFTDANFEVEVLKASGLVLVDFWAEWCGPCHMVAPIIEEIANEEKDVKVGKLNVDENQQTSMRYQIMSIPSIALFKEGEMVEVWIGVRPKSEYMEGIRKHK